MFTPPNTAVLLQPMDQNVIKMVKSNYKKDLRGQDGDNSKSFSIYDTKCTIYNTAYPWRKVTLSTIVKLWEQL